MPNQVPCFHASAGLKDVKTQVVKVHRRAQSFSGLLANALVLNFSGMAVIFDTGYGFQIHQSPLSSKKFCDSFPGYTRLEISKNLGIPSLQRSGEIHLILFTVP